MCRQPSTYRESKRSTTESGRATDDLESGPGCREGKGGVGGRYHSCRGSIHRLVVMMGGERGRYVTHMILV